MIDFKEGTINLNNVAIGFNSTPEELDDWIKTNRAERMKYDNENLIVYRLHLMLDAEMPIDVFIELVNGVLHEVNFRWVTGPLTRAGWEGTPYLQRKECQILIDKISDLVLRAPDQKKQRKSLWQFPWGAGAASADAAATGTLARRCGSARCRLGDAGPCAGDRATPGGAAPQPRRAAAPPGPAGRGTVRV